MKTSLLVLISSIMMSAAFASAATQEMRDLSRILLNNPALSKELKPNCADLLLDYKVSEVESGVKKYALLFGQSRMCSPVEAFVTIIEDMRPTYYDGSPKYKTTVEIKPLN